jgi:predicted ATPase
LLATSREPLRIEGEHVYRMPSLAVPAAGDLLTAAKALEYGGIALFVQRAEASDTKFKLTDESAPIVAEICRRLDGIALAIELAAARVKVLPPRQLAQKLDKRFRVLTGGSRTALPRQQTMRALIDWSYDLLSEHEQKLLRHVSIFVGGWTLEAAEAVVNDETLDALDIIDPISSLVEKSLVVAGAEETPRYRLLESTRAFALEKLEQSGERDALARRHAQWVADLAERAKDASQTEPWALWLAQYVPESENTRSVIDWALSHDEVILAARVATAFYGLFLHLSMYAEVRGWLDAVLRRLDADAQPELAARALDMLANVTLGSRAIEMAQRAVELSQRCNDPGLTVQSLSGLAFWLALGGRPQDAQVVSDRAMQLAHEKGLTQRFRVNTLMAAGTAAFYCGRFDEALQLYGEGFAIAPGHVMAPAFRVNMAEIEYKIGNAARALELVSAIKTEIPRGPIRAIAWANSATYKIVIGDIAGARIDAREGLRLGRGTSWLTTASVVQTLATVAALGGDPRRGARLRGYVDAWYLSEGHERGELAEARSYEILVTALRERLTEAEIDALAAEGAQLSEDQAVAEALAV